MSNFSATLNVLINIKREISLKKFRTLPRELRRCSSRYVLGQRVIIYYEIIPDQLNPNIEQLKKKLKKMKIKYRCFDIFEDGKMKVKFET